MFVLSTLQSLEEKKHKPVEGKDDEVNTLQVLVLCHTRELAYQIKKEYDR